MIDKEQYIRAWQSRVGRKTACLDYDGYTKEELEKLHGYYQIITEYYDTKLNNKVLIDYGCGGGLLGKYLFLFEHNIKKYIGIDIADRCVNEARLNNLCWYNKEVEIDIIKTNPNEPVNISQLKGGILVCINVIRYLPDIEYVNDLLDKFNKSRVKYIALNFRLANKNNFREKKYKTTEDIGLACVLSLQSVVEQMKRYKVVKIKNVGENCFVFFEKKTRERKVIAENDNTISD